MFPELTWDYIIKTRRENSGGSIVPTEAAERALIHLRSILGENANALPERVLRTLLDWSPWTYRWLSWLSSAIARVERVDGFRSLCERLVHQSKFEEAYSVLQVADGLVAGELSVRFDIPVQVGPNLKVPDILVMDSETGTSFYCEVSTLYSAQGQVGQSQILNTIYAVLLRIQTRIPVTFAGRLLRPIANEEVEGLISRIQWELIEIENDLLFHEIDVDGALQLALAPTALNDRVSAWAQVHGLELNSLCGALPETDHVGRLRYKIKEEALQLPAGRPNLVVILAQDLLMAVSSPEDLIPIATDILSENRNVAALVLTCEDFSSVVARERKMDDGLYAVSDRDGLAHKQLLIHSRLCLDTFPASTLEKVYEAFSY